MTSLFVEVRRLKLDPILNTMRNLFSRAWLAGAIVLLALLSGQLQSAAAAPTTESYGTVDGTKLLLQIYGADPGKKKPALLLLHGGAWSQGNPSQMAPAAQFFSTQGYVCFAASYRLIRPGKNRFPAQLDDVQRAVRWIRANAATYGVDGERLGALGASAGAHLALLLGMLETRDNSDKELAAYSSKVQCVVNFAGPTDLRPYLDPAFERSGTLANLMENFLGPLPDSTPLFSLASPVAHVSKNIAPILTVHGAKDDVVPYEQATRLHAALQAAGVEHKLVTLPEAGHNLNGTNAMQLAMEGSQFFARFLKPTASQ